MAPPYPGGVPDRFPQPHKKTPPQCRDLSFSDHHLTMPELPSVPLFLRLVASVLLLLLSPAAASDTDRTDAAAMRDLHNSLLFHTTSLNWSLNSDPCSWGRVTCSSGRVTAVQLGNRTLSGTLPPSLRNLTSLTRLELQQNSISGPLPSLKGLSLLQILLLHDNLFTSMPLDFFSGLGSLQAVSLDHNPFEPWELPDSIRDSSSLVNFSANAVNLTGGVPEVFARNGFPSLNHLALANNLLQGSLPEGFAGSSLTSLWLNQGGVGSGGGLSGSIDVIKNMTNLNQLWLHSNSFSGPLPDFSGLKYLEDLQLRDNKLTGPVPKSLLSLKSLRRVVLSNNLLQGPVPLFPKEVDEVELDPASERFCLPEPGKCDSRVSVLLSVAESFGYPQRFAQDWDGNDPCRGNWLGIGCDRDGNVTVVKFVNMGLSGVISPDLALFPSIEKLLLSGNNITGTIPESLTSLLYLKQLDVSNNSLDGKVPTFSKNVIVNTIGNPGIAKEASGPSGPSSGAGDSGSLSLPGSSDGGKGNAKTSFSVGAVLGYVTGVVILSVGFLGFCLYKRNKKPLGRVHSPNTMVIHPRHSGSGRDLVKVTFAGSTLNGGTGTDSETFSLNGSGSSDVHVVDTGNMVISIQVLRNVTNNFSNENILGRGGFGTVYKGELHDGTKIAVKRMESGVIGSKATTEFQAEIAVLTKVRHRHLVSLLGYCLDGNERLLVYEYMPQGTLSRHLFNWEEEKLEPLEWKRRLSIALDVARGVEYLHTLAHQSFIHRDLKPSNILLGDDMRAKVADFGLVRLAPDGKCSVETRLAGTFGYLAPEYAVTGRVTTKADVFSFGVILMELITGRKALDENRPEESVHLVTWFRRMQLNKDAFHKIIDSTIKLDEETLLSISTVSELAGHCCAREPYQRPDIGHAVNVLSSLSEMWKPTDLDSLDDIYGIDLNMTLPQALKKWQALEDKNHSGVSSSSFLASLDNTQSSIPTKPAGFADSFTSSDGR